MKFVFWTMLALFTVAVACLVGLIGIGLYRSVEYQLFYFDASYWARSDYLDGNSYIRGWAPIILASVIVFGVLSLVSGLRAYIGQPMVEKRKS